jgi:Domain of unknown function (DUF4372)/Transposase DDE domain
MYSGRTVFSQVMDGLPLNEFRNCVDRYGGDHKVKSFSCLDQFLTLAFAQLSGRESLRDIETCLRAMPSRLYHMGFRGRVSRNNLSHANQHRDWRIFADFAQILIAQVRPLYRSDPFGLELEQTVYALDSTTIDLCLSLCPWAPFQRSRGAIKLQTLLDLRGSIPAFILVTHGRVSDKTIIDHLPLETGAFYVMDRGYIHFKRLFTITTSAAFFVIRGHEKLQYRRRYSRPVDRATGLRADQIVMLTGEHTRRDYPLPIRRVRFYDQLNATRFTFVTNNFDLPALTIANLYKSRWQIELFFKWIKQHLRIKAFYGNSANAVKTQIWIAISVYLLVALLKKKLELPHSLYTILQVLSVTLFEKQPILQAFSDADDPTAADASANQLNLFD